MGNVGKCLVSVFLLAVFALPAGAQVPLILNVEVVKADSSTWLADHAAEELATYVEEMTGASVTIVEDESGLENNDVVFVLSLSAAADKLNGLPGAQDERRLRDGFVIESRSAGQLMIAATEPIGLLYGVYEYLEKHCGCGFFWDGDYVPKRGDLPIEDIDVAMLPRWPMRHFGLSSGFGLDKWHHQFRTSEHRKQILGWMAKRKLNRSAHYFGPHIAHGGLPAKEVYGISDTEPDNFTFSGWPGCLDFPAAVRTGIIKEQLDYGRQRGIAWIYYLTYGNVPHQFRQMHPEYKYVGHLGYSATVLYPDDPECTRWTKAFYKAVIETYGTDHIYLDSPFVESTGAADMEKAFQLKLTAAKQMCRVFKELDQEALWESDSWDFPVHPTLWTPERIKRYFAELPQEMMGVYDTAGMGNPQYKKTNYFEGTRWRFGVLHSFQGDDHLHGDLNHAIRAFRELSVDPKADKCEGIYHVPETSGHNVLFFDLTTNLAWNPDGVTLEDYLDQYTRRRFGAADYAAMRPAVKAVVAGVYLGGGQLPIYQKLGCGYGPAGWWPIVDEKTAAHSAENAAGIEELRDAIRLALACRRNQQDNVLYVNDVVDWTRTYMAHVFNWATIDAYKAFKAGDAERMKRSIAVARDCLKHIEAILSTRPDFSLQRQIAWTTRVPGANSYLPWYIKQYCINDLYAANEVYELLHWYYGPRMEVYFGALEKRAAEGVKTIAWSDMADACNAIQDRWLNEDIAVPDKDKFPGTTIEAVALASEEVGRRMKTVLGN